MRHPASMSQLQSVYVLHDFAFVGLHMNNKKIDFVSFKAKWFGGKGFCYAWQEVETSDVTMACLQNCDDIIIGLLSMTFLYAINH